MFSMHSSTAVGPPEEDEDEEDDIMLYIIIGAAGGGVIAIVVVGIVLVCCCCFCCRRDKNAAQPMRKLTTLIKKVNIMAVLCNNFSRLTQNLNPQFFLLRRHRNVIILENQRL